MIIPSLCFFPLFFPAIPLHVLSGLGAPRGIRFSDITATSSMVHWTVPRANVDSYRVTFVPVQGGECKGQENIVTSPVGIQSRWCLLFREIKPSFFFNSSTFWRWGKVFFNFFYLFSCFSRFAGDPETMTTDGTLSETLLPNLIPGETYRVTVVAVKGLEESDPVTDTLTTGMMDVFVFYVFLKKHFNITSLWINNLKGF